MKEVSIKEIIAAIQQEYIIRGNAMLVMVDNVASLEKCNRNSIVWISESKSDRELIINSTNAGIYIVSPGLNLHVVNDSKVLIEVANPRLAFMRIVNELFSKKHVSGIHSSAVINPGAKIGEGVHIGPLTYVGESAIGDGTIIHGGCFIYDNVIIGKNVHIHAGTVIGADGFGYERNEKGELEKFPHIGGVLIEDHVEIGANTCIDKGTIGDTIIRKRAKIDNLVHVAHNVEIGEDVVLIALSMIGGSTKIGKGSWVAPGAVVRDGLVVGMNATAGMGCVLTKNIPDNETWLGSPAKEISQYLQQQRGK